MWYRYKERAINLDFVELFRLATLGTDGGRLIFRFSGDRTELIDFDSYADAAQEYSALILTLYHDGPPEA